MLSVYPEVTLVDPGWFIGLLLNAIHHVTPCESHAYIARCDDMPSLTPSSTPQTTVIERIKAFFRIPLNFMAQLRPKTPFAIRPGPSKTGRTSRTALRPTSKATSSRCSKCGRQRVVCSTSSSSPSSSRLARSSSSLPSATCLYLQPTQVADLTPGDRPPNRACLWHHKVRTRCPSPQALHLHDHRLRTRYPLQLLTRSGFGQG